MYSDVTIGATGYNPYRISQLPSTDLWVKAGMPKELAENYIGAINAALDNRNMSSDMKIPGAITPLGRHRGREPSSPTARVSGEGEAQARRATGSAGVRPRSS